jgi:hypothetical protein
MTNFCQTCGGQKGLYFSTLPGCTCTTAAPFYYPINQPKAVEWFDCTDEQLIAEVRRRGFVIRDAQIEQAEKQEPVAWINKSRNLLSWDKFYADMTPLYTAPPQRQPLTDEEIFEVHKRVDSMQYLTFARAIEAAHGIKGEA